MHYFCAQCKKQIAHGVVPRDHLHCSFLECLYRSARDTMPSMTRCTNEHPGSFVSHCRTNDNQGVARKPLKKLPFLLIPNKPDRQVYTHPRVDQIYLPDFMAVRFGGSENIKSTELNIPEEILGHRYVLKLTFKKYGFDLRTIGFFWEVAGF